MPKKTWTLNGFAGGINSDDDFSDVSSNDGDTNNEVSYVKNVFLENRGKVIGKKPVTSANTSVNIGTQTSGNQNLLIHNNYLYQKTGVYVVGEDVNYSGLSSFLADDMNTTNTGELNPSTPGKVLFPEIYRLI